MSADVRLAARQAGRGGRRTDCSFYRRSRERGSGGCSLSPLGLPEHQLAAARRSGAVRDGIWCRGFRLRPALTLATRRQPIPPPGPQRVPVDGRPPRRRRGRRAAGRCRMGLGHDPDGARGRNAARRRQPRSGVRPAAIGRRVQHPDVGQRACPSAALPPADRPTCSDSPISSATCSVPRRWQQPSSTHSGNSEMPSKLAALSRTSQAANSATST